MAEAGLPGFESLSWYGLWAPAGTPPEILDRLQAEVKTALASPDLVRTWQQQGAEPGGEPRAQFGAYVRTETEKWGKVAREHRIVVD
jgi:tripartite-type tricarboxylate transporter receptor subunit TctC